jgi:hypothetical protein
MGSIVKFWDGKTEWADPQSTLGRYVQTGRGEGKEQREREKERGREGRGNA